MYHNTAAIIRPELMAVVEEAALADQFFIAPQVFPVITKPRKTGEYRRIRRGKGQLMAKVDETALVRAPKSAYAEINRTYEKDSYVCIDRGIKEVIDDSENRDNPTFDEEATSAKLCVRAMQIAAEARVASRTFDASAFGDTDCKVAYTEANLATIDFIHDISQIIKLVRMRGEPMNTLIMNGDLWDIIKRSTLLRQHLYGDNGGGTITPEVVAADQRVQQILIAEATYDKAPKTRKSTDADLAYIWPSTFIFAGYVTGGEFEVGGVGRTIVWDEDAPGLYITETYRDEDKRSDIVRVRQHNVEKVINENSGALLDVVNEA
jgi:hypothetical protein